MDIGYRIGSGVIEGACRNLINDRLEQIRMRWTLKGVESVVRLRAVYINKDWQDLWSFRPKSNGLRFDGIEDKRRETSIRRGTAKKLPDAGKEIVAINYTGPGFIET